MKQIMLFLAIPLAAQHDPAVIPGQRLRIFDVRQMRTGDRACVFPVGASKENHLWMKPENVKEEISHCIFTITKTKAGFSVNLNGIPVYEGKLHDSELRSFGWIMATEVVEK